MITYHPELIQGSDEWHAIRCGLITASAVEAILTPTLKIASNEKECIHLYELLAQRITKYVEPQYVSDAMLRGLGDEIYARALYSEKYAPVTETGFVTNDEFGFVIGYSPDGLVGDDGLIEIKSRMQKYQAQTIVLNQVPAEYMLQMQTGLLVTRRAWCDFVSWCGGMPMFVKRVYPDEKYFAAIIEATTGLEQRLAQAERDYKRNVFAGGYHPTERTVEEDIIA